MASEIARRLRKQPTIAERKLWLELRQLRERGQHFRRQAPLEGYIVDFASLAHRMVIEVDGIQHHATQGLTADAARDAHLRWRGYTVSRFSNGDVRDFRDGVMMHILAALGAIEMPA